MPVRFPRFGEIMPITIHDLARGCRRCRLPAFPGDPGPLTVGDSRREGMRLGQPDMAGRREHDNRKGGAPRRPRVCTLRSPAENAGLVPLQPVGGVESGCDRWSGSIRQMGVEQPAATPALGEGRRRVYLVPVAR